MRRFKSLKASLVVATALTLLPPLAAADTYFYTGNKLLMLLETHADPKDNSYPGGIGLGYVIGISDILGEVGILCVPKEVTAGQIASIVLKYLRQNPEKLHQPANSLTKVALFRTFPCKG